MSIKLANTDLSNIYLGSSQVQKVYLGGTEIYAVGGGGGITTDGLIYSWDAATGDATGMTDSVNGVFMDDNGHTYSTNDGGYYYLGGGTGMKALDANLGLIDSLTEMTLELWYYIVSFKTTNIISNKRSSTSPGGGWIVFYNTTNYNIRVGATVGGNPLATWSTTPVTDAWQQLLITVPNTGNTKFYLNGSEVADVAYTANWANIATGDQDLYINGDVAALGSDTRMSIFRVYDKVLNATEVANNYNAIKDRYGL